MSTSTGPEGLRQRFASAVSRLATRFWEEPAVVSIRLIAVIFALLAVFGLAIQWLGIRSSLGVDVMGALFLVFFAWVLSSKRVSQIIVGMFLIGTFVLSIILLILPVEALVNSFTETMEKDVAKRESMGSVFWEISYAQGSLASLVTAHPELAQDASLRVANNALKNAAERMPKSDENLADQLVRGITRTISNLLKQSAPFVFAMLMGLMGSAIAVSRQFVSNFEEKPAIWYLYRLLQGMIIALLIVYGLVAGMLSLGVNTGNEPIDIAKFDTNKYFIGFVSALAGLFSEHAFAKLESVSANVFGKTDNKGVGQKQPGEPDATARSNGEPATGRQDVGRDGSGA